MATRRGHSKHAHDVAVEMIKKRSGDQCEIAIPGVCTIWPHDPSHRKGAAQGGPWHVTNLLHACRSCHNWIHAHPSVARRNGWMVSGADDDYASVPVLLRQSRLVLLTATGRYMPIKLRPTTGQAASPGGDSPPAASRLPNPMTGALDPCTQPTRSAPGV